MVSQRLISPQAQSRIKAFFVPAASQTFVEACKSLIFHDMHYCLWEIPVWMMRGMLVLHLKSYLYKFDRMSDCPGREPSNTPKDGSENLLIVLIFRLRSSHYNYKPSHIN